MFSFGIQVAQSQHSEMCVFLCGWKVIELDSRFFLGEIQIFWIKH